MLNTFAKGLSKESVLKQSDIQAPSTRLLQNIHCPRARRVFIFVSNLFRGRLVSDQSTVFTVFDQPNGIHSVTL